jgi:acetyl esterase/lipase
VTTRDYMDVPPAPGLRIPYGPEADQFGDLRVPAGAGPHPLAVLIHGGWWKNRYDLTYAGHLANALTANGVATWNVEYRRIGSANGAYPATLCDVTAALAALETFATRHALDLTRIVAVGHSAGAHLAAWLAAKPSHAELDVFGRSPALAGAVAVAGPLDLERTSGLGIVDTTGGNPVHDFLGGSPADVPERYALASPTRLVPTGLPVVAIHGSADDAVPLELSQRYVERARAAGDPAELVVLDGIDHFEPFDPSTAAGGVVLATIRRLLGTATASGAAGLKRA